MKEEEKVAKNREIRQFVNDNQPAEKGERELVIRTGLAPILYEPNAVNLVGVISAPADFYSKRKALHNPDKCHVIFDKQKGQIDLICDEQCEGRNYVIQGCLKANPELEPFQINTAKTFTVKDLMQVLKFNRVHFADKDLNAKIVGSLQNFKAKVDQTLEDSSNDRGQQAQIRITKLEHELQERFVLAMPIFKGGAVISFTVDICVQITSGAVAVWLESRELKDLQVTMKSTIIDKELETFKDIVCIEQ